MLEAASAERRGGNAVAIVRKPLRDDFAGVGEGDPIVGAARVAKPDRVGPRRNQILLDALHRAARVAVREDAWRPGGDEPNSRAPICT